MPFWVSIREKHLSNGYFSPSKQIWALVTNRSASTRKHTDTQRVQIRIKMCFRVTFSSCSFRALFISRRPPTTRAACRHREYTFAKGSYVHNQSDTSALSSRVLLLISHSPSHERTTLDTPVSHIALMSSFFFLSFSKCAKKPKTNLLLNVMQLSTMTKRHLQQHN